MAKDRPIIDWEAAGKVSDMDGAPFRSVVLLAPGQGESTVVTEIVPVQMPHILHLLAWPPGVTLLPSVSDSANFPRATRRRICLER